MTGPRRYGREPPCLEQRGLVVCHDPPAVAAREFQLDGGESEHHLIARERQRHPLCVVACIEDIAVVCRRDDHAGRQRLGAALDVDGMQSINDRPALVGGRHEIHQVRGRIDHGGAEDPEIADDIAISGEREHRHRHRHRPDAGRQIDRPQRRSAGVRIERVNRVAHGCDIHHVVRAAVRDGDPRNVQGLCKDVVVDCKLEEHSKRVRAHIGSVQ